MTPNWQFYKLRAVGASQGGEPIDIPFGPPTNPPTNPTESPTAPNDDGENEQPNTHDCGPTGPSPVIWPLDPYNPWINSPPGWPIDPTPPLPPGYGPWWRPPPVEGPVTIHPTGPSPSAPGTPTPAPTPYPIANQPWIP